MARKLSHTLIVEGALFATTPIHIGGAEEGIATDMPLAIDGFGRYYLPGTSLGGAIRAFCRAEGEDEHWGFAKGEDQGTASRIIVDDAPAINQPATELWHGNGIDRRWGAVAEGIKYDREILPQGSQFRFRLTLEVETSEKIDARRAWLGQLVLALEAGRVPLGAGATRGLGRIRLESTRCHERVWNTPAGILALLDPTPPKDCRTDWLKLAQQVGALNPCGSVRLAIHWRPRAPLMSKAARDGVVVDGLPFLSRIEDGRMALTLPGAGIKGAWRSHAERIVRTATGVCYQIDGKHFEQVDVPLAGELFGRARPEDPASANALSVRRKGRLAVETCYAEFALPTEEWDVLERTEDCWRTPPNANRPMSMAMHVAVDRWTGGAADNLLYSAVEPGRIAWKPIVMHFDVSSKPLAEFALLWLTLRDFCAGHIPLGFGVNRGYGDVEVELVSVSGLSTLQDGNGPDTVTLKLSAGNIETKPIQNVLDLAKTAWQKWLSEQEVAS